jgi:antagonist of KipI
VGVMRVMTPGLSSTLQDGGRRAGLDSGVPPGGAADDLAYRLNCLLLSNAPEAIVVEQALKGGSFEILAPMVVALTGADMSARVNSLPVPLAAALTLEAGDVLETQLATRGCFGYIGIAGGFVGDRVFGSASTYVDGQLGGYGGRRLVAGDLLEAANRDQPLGWTREVTELHEFLCAPPGELRFTRGPQDDYFDDEAYGVFTSEVYRVSPRSNRVGYRIDGLCPPVLPVARTADTGSGPTDIIEEGNPVGGIQVAGGKEIICLGRDCGTSGAYAKIGCLIGTDVSRMAQLAPGQQFRFTEVSVSQARAIRAEYAGQLASVLKSRGQPGSAQPDPSRNRSDVPLDSRRHPLAERKH